jgi:hypothetical protein
MKPLLQDRPQISAEQVGTPLVVPGQTFPHPPQLLVVLSGVSQPLAAIASQLPKPMLQAARAHEPVEQEALAFANAQAAPHAPQLLRLSSGVSQPSAAIASQLSKPVLQAARTQVPVEQEGLAFGNAQASPHAPQLLTSSSTH